MSVVCTDTGSVDLPLGRPGQPALGEECNTKTRREQTQSRWRPELRILRKRKRKAREGAATQKGREEKAAGRHAGAGALGITVYRVSSG